MKACVFAGTFDPFTAGHYEIVKKALCVFDKVVVAIGTNKSKKPFFTLDERLQILKEVFRDKKNVEVTFFEGFLIDFMKENKIKYNIRGIRNSRDYEYESEMEKFNSERYSDLVTIYITADEKNTKISSTAFRELEKLKKDYNVILNGLPESAIELIKNFTEKK